MDLDRAVELSHQAVDAFTTGDPEPLKALYSHEPDVSIANPFGPPVRGWPAAGETMDRAAGYYREGRATSFERMAGYESPDLAYVVEIEHIESKLGGSDVLSHVALRVTTVFRREGGSWKIVHRHADPITTPRSPASVIQSS